MANLVSGRKTVTTAGTPVQLAASAAVNSLVVQALVANTGTIAVGGTSSTTSAGGTKQGVQLAAGQSLPIDTDDLSDVWIDSSVNGEGVTYTAVSTV